MVKWRTEDRLQRVKLVSMMPGRVQLGSRWLAPRGRSFCYFCPSGWQSYSWLCSLFFYITLLLCHFAFLMRCNLVLTSRFLFLVVQISFYIFVGVFHVVVARSWRDGLFRAPNIVAPFAVETTRSFHNCTGLAKRARATVVQYNTTTTRIDVLRAQQYDINTLPFHRYCGVFSLIFCTDMLPRGPICKICTMYVFDLFDLYGGRIDHKHSHPRISCVSCLYNTLKYGYLTGKDRSFSEAVTFTL